MASLESISNIIGPTDAKENAVFAVERRFDARLLPAAAVTFARNASARRVCGKQAAGEAGRETADERKRV